MDTRKISFEILKRIELEDAFVGEVLDSALRTMQFSDKRDRAFITRLVEGVTERRISLDFLIGKFSKKDSRRNKTSEIDTTIILRMGIYQIRYMDSVPDSAAVSEMVKLTKTLGYQGLAGYVNGLLRNVSRAKEEKKLDSYLVSRMDARYSTPQWLCDFFTQTYGKEMAKTILEDQYKEHDTVVRVNTLKTTVPDLKELFEKNKITVKTGILSDRSLRISGYDSVRRLPGYKDGLFAIQDETSTYTVEHIGIKPGDRVLDICSAPGGKSLLAYELTCGTDKNGNAVCGTIVSRDISENKIEKIYENAQRLGIPSSKIEIGLHNANPRNIYQQGINLEISDATELDESLASLPDKEKYDVVIADVPCSGLGIIGRKNDIKYHMSPEIMEELAEQGLNILTNASKYVKPFGRICFSTCTINPAENQDVVRAFLDTANKMAKAPHYQGALPYSIIDERTFLQGRDGSDGFYYCILSRNV
ncbi:16S rRNA (cytosine967-C5)-methyltransferase [Lachnospiraceae bacterium NE2001]|nr:16S rRNA (cytosine967-C5)-methyltransferase [Lachnospiraceae bacterium NE2001]